MKTLELLPPTETMYRALVNRDPSFEGIFYIGAKTSIFLQHQATRWKTVIGLACDAIRSIQMRVRRS